MDYFNRPDGSTVESREELAGDFPKWSDWKIAKEMDIFINAALSKDYSMSVVYYDEAGNKRRF